MILLDTSILSRVFGRRRPGPQERQLQAAVEALMVGDASLGLPGAVLQEVLSGIRSLKQFADLERRLLASFSIVHPSTTDYVEAARLRNTCLGRGLDVSGVDCLIATLTMTGGHELFAADTHFSAIARHTPLKLYKVERRGRAGRRTLTHA